jgi:hypothetical protein
MYAATRDIDDTRTLHAALGTLKAKIVNLHQGLNQRYFLGMTEGEQQEKEPTLIHLIRKWKRQKQHHVETVRDKQGNLCTSTAEKLRVFVEHLRQKLADISIDQHAIQDLLDGVNVHLDVATHIGFQQSIMETELHMAVWRGKRNKAPGYDGVPTNFLQLLWPIIKDDLLQVINEMYLGGALPRMQTRGVVVCPQNTTAHVTRGISIADFTQFRCTIICTYNSKSYTTMANRVNTPQSVWRSGGQQYTGCIGGIKRNGRYG